MYYEYYDTKVGPYLPYICPSFMVWRLFLWVGNLHTKVNNYGDEGFNGGNLFDFVELILYLLNRTTQKIM